ncbi:hypothetical protein [Staphylococcus warneri]|uniref:hypothetical protein n=2 Tax=Staphylococcus warneri TaxID=1292 RepID=UPI00259FE9B8|nr:hypothetical protein [Staphylococcus warneri]MDM7466820.1 hypothetical protein [Staphylococcus warneri]
MNFYINRVDNLKINGQKNNFIPKEMENEIQIKGTLGFLNSKENSDMLSIKYLEEYQLLTIKSLNILKSKPLIIFMYPSDDSDFSIFDEKDKEKADILYGNKNISLNNVIGSFLLATWLIKDNCISVTESYHINPFNHYNSKYTISNSYTMSDGTREEIFFTNEEIKYAIELSYELLELLMKKVEGDSRINITSNNGTSFWNIDERVEKIFSTNTNCYTRVLIYLQQVRKSTTVQEKLSIYCTILDSIFAIKKDTTKELKRITSAIIGKNGREVSEIMHNVGNAYWIRSNREHGDDIKYLKENSVQDMKDLSKKMDSYVRAVVQYALKNEQLNYNFSEIEEKAFTRAHYKGIAKKVHDE